MRVLLAVLAIFSMCGSADAQIFRGKLFGRGQAQVSNCPGGVCPTNMGQQQSDLRQVHNQLHGGGEWTWPRNQTLVQHLAKDHGYNPGVASTSVSRQGPFRSYQASSYSSSAASAAVPTYGSAGSQVRSYGSVGSAPIVTSVTYGSSAVQVVAPAGVNFVPTEAAFSEVVVGTGFRAEAVRAVIESRKAGKITPREAMRLRVAFLSPAFAKNAEELAVVQMSSSGENPEALPMNADGTINVAGINWEGLAKFLQAMIPLLLTMLKALGLGA